jgi:hypothetical protein
MDEEPTHALPPKLVAKLIEAKAWYDDRQEQVAAGIPDSKKWMNSDLEGNHLLTEIVEIIDGTWGFAVELRKPGS